jgi:type II secretory pathway predicted ATPase ExeA
MGKRDRGKSQTSRRRWRVSWYKELGLPYNPFDRPILETVDIFQSRDLQNLQDAVSECLTQRQMLVAIGPAGAGKTTVIFDMLRGEDPNLLLIRDITMQIEGLRIHHLEEAIIRAILERTGQMEVLRKSGPARLEQLRRVLGHFAIDHEVVLVLEDGHKIPAQTLINLKRLRELRYAWQERLLSVVILAQTAMRGRLREIREVDLRSQIAEMQGLDKAEVRGYIECRLAGTGVTLDKLFDGEALKILCESLHWPLEINNVCEKLLKDAVEVGMVPVTADLARKYCNAEAQLTALWIASGMTVSEVWKELLTRGFKNLARATVLRLLQGFPINDARLPAAVRELLTPFAGQMAVLYDPQTMGVTSEQSRLLDEINRDIHALGERFDYGKIARKSGLPHRRIRELERGVRVTTTDLQMLSKAVKWAGKKAA